MFVDFTYKRGQEKNLKAPMVSALEVFESIKESLKNTEKADMDTSQTVKSNSSVVTPSTNQLRESVVIKPVQEEQKVAKLQELTRSTNVMMRKSITPMSPEKVIRTSAMVKSPVKGGVQDTMGGFTRNPKNSMTTKLAPEKRAELDNMLAKIDAANKSNTNATIDSNNSTIQKKPTLSKAVDSIDSTKQQIPEVTRAINRTSTTMPDKQAILNKLQTNSVNMQNKQPTSSISTTTNPDTKALQQNRKTPSISSQLDISSNKSSTKEMPITQRAPVAKQTQPVARNKILSPPRTQIIVEKEYTQNLFELNKKEESNRSITTKNTTAKKIEYNQSSGQTNLRNEKGKDSSIDLNLSIGSTNVLKGYATSKNSSIVQASAYSSLTRSNTILNVLSNPQMNKTSGQFLLKDAGVKQFEGAKMPVKKEPVLEVIRRTDRSATTKVAVSNKK